MARNYQHHTTRYVTYHRRDGSEVQLQLRGRHAVETVCAALRDYEEGELPRRIAERYDIPLRTLEHLCRRAGVRRTRGEAAANHAVRDGRPSPVALTRKAERLYVHEKMSTIQIAEELETNRAHVLDMLRRRGVELRSRREANILRYWGSAEARNRAAARARTMLEQGALRKDVCEELDICYPTLTRLLEETEPDEPTHDRSWWMQDVHVKRAEHPGIPVHHIAA